MKNSTNLLLITLTHCLLAEICQAQTAETSAPGDRNLLISQIYPSDAFYHNSKGGRILDVTKPPFNAKGDGRSDDTQALIAAMRFVRNHYELIHGKDFSLCEKKNNRNWIIYLPDGEYLISDTVSQGWPARAINILKGWSHVQTVEVHSREHEAQLNADGARRVYSEINWAIRIVGQSRNKTVIRLKDSAQGFGKGSEKPVITFYLLKQGSNVNNGNVIQNLTIDTGRSNPGAIGLRWSASNYGGIRNVAIRSAEGYGRAGLLMDRRNATSYLHDIIIDGFDVGIELSASAETAVALEHATLSRQRKTAIRVGGEQPGHICLSARKIATHDSPVALRSINGSQVILLDSKLTSTLDSTAAMIVENNGYLLARDVDISGYSSAVTKDGTHPIKGTFIKEYASSDPISLHGDAPVKSLRLPVKDTPFVKPETDLTKWANVDSFGAAGDGIKDDTSAIQRAMNAGKPVVYFPKANYVINGTVNIPAGVQEITWLFGGVHRSIATEKDGPGLFRVAESSTKPLRIHGAITAGGVFLDHDADRPVILEDIEVWFHHCRSYAGRADMLFPSPAAQDTSIWRIYRNTRPAGVTKEVFVNNSLFFAANDKDNKHALENVKAWARMINSEHLPGAQYAFRRSDAWILGFKSENADQLLQADDHTRLEVLGGSFLNWAQKKGPAITSNNSRIFVVCYMWSILPETILRVDNSGSIGILPAMRFPVQNKGNGAIISIQ